MAEYKPVAPSADYYGVFPQALAQLYASKSGNPGLDAVRQIALMAQAQRQGGEYLTGQREARANQLAGQAASDRADVAKSAISATAPLAAAGALDAVQFADNPYFKVNSPAASLRDATVLNNREGETFQRKAAGVSNLAESGYGIPAGAVGQVLQGAADEQPMAVAEGYMTPKQSSDRTSANAQMLNAQAHMVDARKPPGSKDGDGSGLKATYTDPETGLAVRGSEADVRQYMDNQGNLVRTPVAAGGSAAQTTPEWDATPIDRKVALWRSAGRKVQQQGNTVQFVDPRGTTMSYDKRTNRRLK